MTEKHTPGERERFEAAMRESGNTDLCWEADSEHYEYSDNAWLGWQAAKADAAGKQAAGDPHGSVGDDVPCSKCGSPLDTGLECTECGHDMAPMLNGLTRAETEASVATMPPLPEWSKMDNLGDHVPSEIRAELRKYAEAYAAPIAAERDERRSVCESQMREIERLRERVAALEQMVGPPNNDTETAARAYWDLATELALPEGSSVIDAVLHLRTLNAELAGALEEMLNYFGSPKRDEWLSDDAFACAKAVEVRARAVLAKLEKPL